MKRFGSAAVHAPNQRHRCAARSRRIGGAILAGWVLCWGAVVLPVAGQEAAGKADDDQQQAMMLTARAFRIAAESIEPSLVSIESFGGVGTRQGRIGGIRSQGEGNTTGVVVSADGYILTSTFNFVQSPPVVTVMTRDGRRHVAKLLGRDDTRKLSLLKIDDVEDLPVPQMVPVEDVRVGQWAISVGVGYGDRQPAVSMGIISATNRVGGRAIQTDANISPANYGGPLVDIEGRMLGICVPMNPQSQAVAAGVEWYDSGIGFAVPVGEVTQLIERLKDGTRIQPAFVGVQTAPNPEGDGLQVVKTVEGSGADQAGLAEGDLILAFGDQPVNDLLKLRQLLNRMEAGDQVSLTIRKAGETDDQQVELTLSPPPRSPEMENQLEPPSIR